MMEVRKKENETSNALIYRFLKRIQHSGILREAKKRRFRDRSANRMKRRLSALHRENKKKEVEKAKKLGIL